MTLTYENLIRETLKQHGSKLLAEIDSPLSRRLEASLRAQEMAKWMAGRGDISMGISYEMKGWGDAEH